MNKTITAGILVRKPIRRYLMTEQIKFKEEKGILDSLFILHCSDEKYTKTYTIIKEWAKTN